VCRRRRRRRVTVAVPSQVYYTESADRPSSFAPDVGPLSSPVRRIRPHLALSRRRRPHDGRQHGYGTVDTHRQQTPRCVHPAGRAHAARPTPDRGGRWSERW